MLEFLLTGLVCTNAIKSLLMKTLALVLLTTFCMQAQVEISNQKLLGEWKGVEESISVFFSENKQGELLVEAFSSTSNKPLEVLQVDIMQYSIILHTLFESTDWRVQTRFVMFDDTTMLGLVSGDSDSELIFKKVSQPKTIAAKVR